MNLPSRDSMTVTSPRCSFFRPVSLFLIVAFLLSACSPNAPAPTLLPTATDHSDPTSILLIPRTPTASPIPGPTFTALPPADTATPDPGVDDPENYYGGLVIDMEYVGQTLMMKPKRAFLLRLGQDYAWNVTIDPPTVLTQNTKILPEPGEQGVYVARKVGKATLRAIGDPVCRQTDPPCSRPALLFTLKIIVE